MINLIINSQPIQVNNFYFLAYLFTTLRLLELNQIPTGKSKLTH